MTDFRKRKAKNEETSRIARDVIGLDELLLDNDEDETKQIPPHHILVLLPPSQFYVDEQVRKQIDSFDIEQRAASMRANGQIQAIVVYPPDVKGKNKGKYKIDKGECRWRAAQLIKGFELKALIDPDAPERIRRKRIVGQIVENDQRADLRPLEMAQALEELLNDGMTQEEVAVELGWITRSKKPNINKVSRTLSIMKMPEEGKKLAEDKLVTDLIALEYLRKINDINPNKFSALCDLAREDEGLSRKRAEQEYKQCKANQNSVDDGNPELSPTALAPKASSNPQSDVVKVTVAESDAVKNQPTTLLMNTAPVIQVEWKGIQAGTLMFDKEPEGDGYIWVRLEKTGDQISAELDELKIKGVSF